MDMLKTRKRLFALLVVGILVGASFSVGVYTGYTKVSDVEKVQTLQNKETNKPEQVDFSLFWKAWNTLNEKYATTKTATTSDQEKVYGAIQGLAASLGDPYTVFFPPAESKSFQNEISGNFEGVGMEVGMQNDMLTVISPLKGTPAEKAGIKPGDKLVEINGTSTQGLSVDAAIKMIRGEKGTSVDLTLIREGLNAPLRLKVTREVISIPTIEGKQLANGIYKISLYSFSEKSPTLFRNTLNEFVNSGSKKLILDLRGNPGGYLEAAVDIASWFLPKDVVVVSEDFGGKKPPIVYKSKGYNVFNENLKLIILVDAGSASASEILAGALREHGVATLVGDTTFGKGSVQELIAITPTTSLKVTVARWLTPKGNSISEGGLKPDYEVKVTKEELEKKVDSQLDKAIELLKAK